MSYASGTTHYNLPQTVGSDKRDWTDTNQAFSDIDAAIYGAAQGASAATSAIQTINGQIDTISGKQTVDEGNISTLAGKVSTLESTVSTQGAAITDVRQDLQDNIESNHEASATSTHLYNIGDTFYYNDVLYKATAQIAIGGTIVPSTNCTAVTVMSEIDQLNSDLTWKSAGSTSALNTPLALPSLDNVKELWFDFTILIDGTAQISDSMTVLVPLLSENRNFRFCFDSGSQVGNAQISYNKQNNTVQITDVSYSVGTLTSFTCLAYYR